MFNQKLDLKKDRFLPYISKIVFPNFKNIAANSELNFESAITILTGSNGSGKSSILHALYGCPKGYNIGKFWFSTEFDDINENNCFFYEYCEGASIKQKYQVLIKRSPRPDKQEYKHKGNSNYWETARPVKKLGMEVSEDRPPQITKEVFYIDFRANLTAFDKFMYFKSFNTQSTKADYKKQNTFKNLKASWGEEKDKKAKQFFQFLQESIKFLPANDAEDFILSNCNKDEIPQNELRILEEYTRNPDFKGKKIFEEIAKYRLRKEQVESDEMFIYQKEYLAKLSADKLKEFSTLIES